MVLAKVSSHGASEKLSNCVLVNGRDNRISQVFGEREQKRLKCDSVGSMVGEENQELISDMLTLKIISGHHAKYSIVCESVCLHGWRTYFKPGGVNMEVIFGEIFQTIRLRA